MHITHKQQQYIIERLSAQPELINEIDVDGVNYPEDIKLLHGVIEKSLSKIGSFSSKDSLLLVLNIASDMGGHQFYLPKANTLLAEFRKVLMKYDFNGKNTEELSYKYGVSTNCVQNLLRSTPRLNYIKPELRARERASLSMQSKWPRRVVEFCEVIEDALAALGLSNAVNTQTIALHIMQKYGGRQVYFPRGDVIKRHFEHHEMYQLRCQGIPVRKIAKQFDTSSKTVYEICAKFKKENEQLGGSCE